jgi:hypothetical protein
MTSQEAVILIDISLTNEEALNVVETYARIQIEKDREEAVLKACQYGIGYNEIKIEQAIKDRPITLD